ncbi:MAG: hypothetical protein KJ718_06510 [Nanoarchaeota archaeon]|nr:hypothetical protein [Nanoarchaeota archaeon]MBU1052170.1 hypothetical protein [Nanoarchaeota archaeon]
MEVGTNNWLTLDIIEVKSAAMWKNKYSSKASWYQPGHGGIKTKKWSGSINRTEGNYKVDFYKIQKNSFP